MSEPILSDILLALKFAVFQRNSAGSLRLVGEAPTWMGELWPVVAGSRGELRPDTSPFVENFLVDAAAAWQKSGNHRVSSGPWVERAVDGREFCLQATAFTAGERATLLIEEIGPAFEERTSLLQKAHEAALAYEKLLRAEQALAEQKHLLEQRVQERTAELSRANAALQHEIATRQRYAERLQGLREIDRAILAARSPEEIAEAALRRLDPLLPCEHAGVVELNPESGRATVLAAIHGGELSSGRGWRLSPAQLREARVLSSGELHRTTNAANLFELRPDRPGREPGVWPLIVDLPLVAEETLVGVLTLATRTPAAFTLEHEEIAGEIAAQLAISIRQARLFAQLSAGREQMRALSLRLVDVQETERRFMAHELHDEIGQLLTGLKLTLELSGHESGHPPDANVREAIALADELMERVRQLSLDLRPQILDDLGLLPALHWLFKRYHRQTGVQVRFRHTSLEGRLPSQLETAAFRIVQEALSNIARHAGVQEASVRVWQNGARLGVLVEDRGRGFDVEQALAGHASCGVAGMRERAVMLGGEFHLESNDGEGTRLMVELPLPQKDDLEPAGGTTP
ncbi:MAG TPA: hypothetical protein DCY13_23210 [Verrucomicrobiales bacterium]|nr:hypothetical protein [Verrucomicrobiales bacterium]